jgi:hypothetical protein
MLAVLMLAVLTLAVLMLVLMFVELEICVSILLDMEQAIYN